MVVSFSPLDKSFGLMVTGTLDLTPRRSACAHAGVSTPGSTPHQHPPAGTSRRKTRTEAPYSTVRQAQGRDAAPKRVMFFCLMTAPVEACGSPRLREGTGAMPSPGASRTQRVLGKKVEATRARDGPQEGAGAEVWRQLLQDGLMGKRRGDQDDNVGPRDGLQRGAVSETGPRQAIAAASRSKKPPRTSSALEEMTLGLAL